MAADEAVNDDFGDEDDLVEERLGDSADGRKAGAVTEAELDGKDGPADALAEAAPPLHCRNADAANGWALSSSGCEASLLSAATLSEEA